jgi:hypothetical protein
MMQDNSTLVQKRSGRHPRRRLSSRRPADLRTAAEDLLREVAFVCRATQAVRKGMEQSARPSA